MQIPSYGVANNNGNNQTLNDNSDNNHRKSLTPVESTLTGVLSWNHHLLIQSFALFEQLDNGDGDNAYEMLKSNMESIKSNLELSDVLYDVAYKKKPVLKAKKELRVWIKRHIKRSRASSCRNFYLRRMRARSQSNKSKQQQQQ